MESWRRVIVGGKVGGWQLARLGEIFFLCAFLRIFMAIQERERAVILIWLFRRKIGYGGRRAVMEGAEEVFSFLDLSLAPRPAYWISATYSLHPESSVVDPRKRELAGGLFGDSRLDIGFRQRKERFPPKIRYNH